MHGNSETPVSESFQLIIFVVQVVKRNQNRAISIPMLIPMRSICGIQTPKKNLMAPS